jgi:hypothetical protein
MFALARQGCKTPATDGSKGWQKQSREAPFQIHLFQARDLASLKTGLGFLGIGAHQEKGLPGWCSGIVSAQAESGLPFSGCFEEAFPFPGSFPSGSFLKKIFGGGFDVVAGLAWHRALVFFALRWLKLQKTCQTEGFSKSVCVCVFMCTHVCTCVFRRTHLHTHMYREEERNPVI